MAAEVADRVAAIWSSRWSADRIAQMVEALYALRSYEPSELAAFAKSPRQNPYRARVGDCERIHCGHNPSLYGRRVDKLVVQADPTTGVETISWVEPPVFAPAPDSSGRSPIVEPPRPVTCSRRVVGPLSSEEVWDRASGQFKLGFKPPGGGET